MAMTIEISSFEVYIEFVKLRVDVIIEIYRRISDITMSNYLYICFKFRYETIDL